MKAVPCCRAVTECVLGRDTLVTPAWAVLLMVCSWSLYFAQSVTEAIAFRAPALHGLCPLHDKSENWALGRRRGIQAFYVYVARSQQDADTVLNQWRGLSAEHGLVLHKSELGQQWEVLGSSTICDAEKFRAVLQKWSSVSLPSCSWVLD